MAGVRLAALVRSLRRGAAPDPGGCSDADLLARFVAARDEAAFELLVWRHGGMVLAACQRALGHTEDAEDAFQAVFLVLARKAGTVRRGTTVPAWLHRVAVRVARRASAGRRPVAALGADPPARAEPDAAERGELRGLLDAAIDRLSEPLRRAFVLCYLEGLSNAEVARELGCPVGTVESRLTAARRDLRDRLARHAALPAGVLAVLGCQPVLTAGVVAATARGGTAAAVGGPRAAIGSVREPAVRLAEGVLAMTNARVWFAAILGAAVLGAAGVGWASHAEPPAPPSAQPAVAAAGAPDAPPVAPPPKSAAPAAKDSAWPLAKEFRRGPWSDATLISVTPDGNSILFMDSRTLYEFSLVGERLGINLRSSNVFLGAAVSPDGKSIATAEGANGVKLREAATGRVVEALWPSGELPASRVTFTPDGAKLIVLCSGGDSPVPAKKGERRPKSTKLTRVSVWDVATRKELSHVGQKDTAEAGAMPEYTLVGRGQFVLKMEDVYEAEGDTFGRLKSRRFTVTDAVSGVAGKTIEVAGENVGAVRSDALSPDGKTLALLDYAQNELRFLDSGTGKERFRAPAFRRPVWAFAFSPDGKLAAAATGTNTSGRAGPVAAPSEVVIWETATGRELARLTDKESIRDYSALAFSPDGSFLVAQTRPNESTITIWGHPPVPPPAPVKPAPVKPAPKAPDTSAAPARFQSLFGDLSGAGVTDSRRVEALFLAALGRFPTDVEARTLTAQLAGRTDKAAALRDLLTTLAETAEFKAHAEELGRMVK